MLFVHGGPGGGTNPAMARYFDPAVYHIILVDQRGCGDSEPFAVLDENSTYDRYDSFFYSGRYAIDISLPPSLRPQHSSYYHHLFLLFPLDTV